MRVNRRLLAVRVNRRLSAATECETVGCRLRLKEAEKETSTGGRNWVVYFRQNVVPAKTQNREIIIMIFYTSYVQ